jgi:type I restriction enzyme M protein
MQTFQTEQNTRTLVDEQLKNLGWQLKHDENCNVFQEQPRTTEEKQLLQGKRPDYVLYSSGADRNQPIAVIETKKPGSSLEDALKQGDWYAEKLGAPLVFATDGIYFKTFHTEKNSPLFLNGEEVDELMRELEALKFLENNEVNTISKEVIDSRKELISIFEESNNILRDEGLRAGIERFGEFSNILFLKLIGELEDLKEEEGRDDEIVLEKYLRWSQWKNKSGAELLSFVNDTVLPSIGRTYKDEDIFTKLTIKNPDVLQKIIRKLDPLNLINIDSDIKGDSFEYFLKQSTATKNDLGEYFTPRHIVKVMVKLLNPQIGEKIYDPFCGTGGTLIESFKHISSTMARTPDNWKRLKENTLFGNEITTTARITKMNMILVGDGHSGIRQQNSLKNPVHSKYDVVITNMPYSQKTEYGSLYDLPSTNGDSICIQHCIEAIDKTSEGGRMALVVPEGFLFRKDLQKTREYLLDRCVLKSVISLPQGVFLPYTGVKTNILYLTDVKKKVKQDKFWYFDVKNDGYSLDNHRRKLAGETDLQKFLTYRNIDAQDPKEVLSVGFSQIRMEDVRKNDFVLVGSRYRKLIDHSSVTWDIVRVGDIASIISGYAFESKSFNKETGLPLIRIRDLKNGYSETKYSGDYSDDYLVDNGDLLVGMDGDFSPAIWNGGRALLNQRVCKLYDFKNSDKEYLLYIIKKALKHIEEHTPHTTVKHISAKQILDIQVPLPPLSVQQKILNELKEYESIINGARQVLRNYKPSIEVKESWPLTDLDKIASFQYGFTAVAKDSGDTRFIRITDISDKGKLKQNDLKYVDLSDDNKAYLLQSGDILMARTGATFGKTLMYEGDVNSIFASYLIRISLDQKIMLPYFYWAYSQGQDYWEQAKSLVGGTGQPQFNANALRKVQIPLPSLEEQLSIINKLQTEQALVDSSKELIKIYEKKIQAKLEFIWGN